MKDKEFVGSGMPEGRVPLEDLPGWIKVLTEKPSPYSEKELKGFLKDHLLEYFMDLDAEKVSEAECMAKIMSDIDKSQTAISENLKQYIKDSIRGFYSGYNLETK